VGVIVGRDVALVGGAFYIRARALRWRWPGAQEFFRIVPPQPGPDAAGGNAAAAAASRAAPSAAPHPGAARGGGAGRDDAAAAAAAGGGGPAPVAPLVQPLLSSKVNTGLQLALVGGCMGTAWVGWPGPEAVWGLGAATAGTTLWTCAAYARAYQRGELLAAGAGRG
jgi:hypothetical protein